jgi:KipI family sensor histidine kinase inhibitor
MKRRILPCGDLAFLVELDGLEEVFALHALLTSDPQPGQVEVVAAARTVLVKAGSPDAAQQLAAHVRALEVTEQIERDSTLVTIDVLYDGEDLADVAELLGMSEQAVIDAHTGQIWTAAFGGFAPGFTYCVGENNILDVPRRPSPRTLLPARSVGIAGQFSAVYPRATPGGWQLLGRAAQLMWDATAEKPAYVAPGNRVQYRAVRELIEVPEPVRVPPQHTGSAIEVVRPGLQALIQDLGRPGYADMGVPEAGAMDIDSARRANKLVGNEPSAALIENLLGGLVIRAISDQVLAIAGATVPLKVTGPGLDDERLSVYEPVVNRPFALLDGQTLTIGTPESGTRAYLAVRGGLDAIEVLGSKSTDLLSGEGPAPLTAGFQIPVLPPSFPHIVSAPDAGHLIPRGRMTARITLGPRDDWFDGDAIDSFLTQEWTITDRSNRVGLRLEGIPIARREGMGELPSEGMVAGAIQIPPEGNPVVFMRDHATTGGYPVLGVVESRDLSLLAQLPAGSKVRFGLFQRPSLADDVIGGESATTKESR